MNQEPRGGPHTISLSVEQFLLVTYACPVPVAQALLPPRLAIDPWEDQDRGPLALFSATCFLSRDVRPSLTGWPRTTYWQSTFRVYCRDSRTNQPGAYFLATYVQRGPGFNLQRTIAHHVLPANYNGSGAIDHTSDWRMAMEANAGEEILRLAAEGPAHVAEPELSRFITHRLHGWTRLSLFPLGNMQVRHPVMSPWTGTLTDVRIDRFRQLGLLNEETEREPYAVYLTPQAPFVGLPPMPMG